MGLLNAENSACICLCEAATLAYAVDMQSEMGLKQLGFAIGETDIGKPLPLLFSTRLGFLVAIVNCSFAG